MRASSTVAALAALFAVASCGEPSTSPPQVPSEPTALFSGPAPYQYEVLPTPGFSASAVAINAAGQIVGAGTVPGKSGRRGLLWDGGTAIDLGDLGPLGFPIPRAPNPVEATGINASGQVVGWLRYPGSYRAFLWEDGVMTDLGSLPITGGGPYVWAFGINARGQVVGQSWTDQGGRAFLWENGTMINLGAPSWGPESAANAINASGTVAGYSDNRPVIWRNREMVELTGFGAGNGAATAINARGQVVGYVEVNCCWSGPNRAFLWADGEMVDLGTLGGPSSFAYGINDRGQVVGSAETTGGEIHAFLWENGVMTDLGPAGGSHSGAQAISPLGIIAGWSTGGVSAAVVWR